MFERHELSEYEVFESGVGVLHVLVLAAKKT